MPAFDRLVREAVHRLNQAKDRPLAGTVHEVSDVALGFRGVFGHLI